MSYFPNVPVPPVNSATDDFQSEVVGNKSDDEAGSSIYSRCYKTDTHDHSVCMVYPTMAAGAGVTKSGTPWTLGAFAVVIPAGVITDDFDVHGVNYDDIPTAGVYELVLYAGPNGGEVEVGRIRFTRTGTSAVETESPIQTPIIAANSQIKAKLAGSNGSTTTVVISLRYHVY